MHEQVQTLSESRCSYLACNGTLRRLSVLNIIRVEACLQRDGISRNGNTRLAEKRKQKKKIEIN